MKTFIFIVLGLTARMALAFEWEGGVREIYLTKLSYTYNSDTAARIFRELVDRGHSGIVLQPRIAWSGDEKSLFYQPTIKTSLFDLAVSNTRVLQLGSRMILRPMVFDNPGLGEGIPSETIRPRRPDLALVSYDQIMTQFTNITRLHKVDRLVVGSGIAHLLSQPEIIPRFESMLKNIRKNAGPKTEISLEILGTEDLKALTSALKSNRPLNLSGLVDSLSYVADPVTHFPGGEFNPDEMRKSRLILESIAPRLPVHLARVVIPGCATPRVRSHEFICENQKTDSKLQLARFQKLKDGLLRLENDGIRFGTVEIFESNTDYEPETIDARYPYYNPLFRDPKVYELPVVEAQVSRPYPLPHLSGKKKGCIYYDKLPMMAKPDRIGEIHAMMLQSVLGAFPAWDFGRKSLQEYKRGEISQCRSVFYLATNFSQKPPEGFTEELADLSETTPVVWFNYKFPLLAETLKKKGRDPGFDAPFIIQPDTVPGPENQKPGFYSQFDYKGETFFKISKWNPLSDTFEASAEINLIKIHEPSRVNVLSTARHDKTNNSLPYAVRSGNIWYVGDSPFSFVHYEDRFYIFCDFLWDILKETPPRERVALVRIEDIHPLLNMHDLKWVTDYLASEKVPFSIAMIPFYSDLFGNNTASNVPVFTPANKYKNFVGQMKYAQNRGADFVMHGTIHSVGCLISGYDGLSGADYEFWLYPENKPLPFDSVDWVTRRLEMGIKVFQEMGIQPVAFEAPHYAASVLDYMIFAKMFKWQYHRSIFMPFEVHKDTGLPRHLRAFDCDPAKCGDERRKILNNLKVSADYTAFSGINSPFITHRDVYGQSIIPETLGMVDFSFYPSHTWRPVSKPEDILRRAKKLKVIRGAVASFFWHPLLLDRVNIYYQQHPESYADIGGKKSLTMLINGLRDLGYEFKSTSDKTLFPDEVI